MTKEIVGISASLRPFDAAGRNMHISVNRKFSDDIRMLGGLPFILPQTDKSLAKDYISQIDRLILTGGEDVHPQFYGQNVCTQKSDFNVERDLFELALLEEALRQNKPVMGVCRGMQLINVAFGGSLNQHIENHWKETPFDTAHTVETKSGSQVDRLIGDQANINSLHHQSVNRIGQGFIVSARDPRDQTIEAIERTDSQRILGIQWHPEFLVNQEKGNLELFQYFMNQL